MNAATATKIERINEKVMDAAPNVIVGYLFLLVGFVMFSIITGMSTIATATILMPAVLIPTALGIALVVASVVLNVVTDDVLDRP